MKDILENPDKTWWWSAISGNPFTLEKTNISSSNIASTWLAIESSNIGTESGVTRDIQLAREG